MKEKVSGTKSRQGRGHIVCLYRQGKVLEWVAEMNDGMVMDHSDSYAEGNENTVMTEKKRQQSHLSR